jgi:transcriptional regulator with XRE-family HTH domain
MTTIPNTKLKMFLFEKGISQRELAFATRIDEAQISKAIKYGQSNEEMRKKICRFLKVDKDELFPWDE